MKTKLVQISIWLIIAFPCLLLAQNDTAQLKLTFEQAQARLLEKNLEVLAAHYQIDIAQAQVRQAKLWNNPYFILNQDLYSVERNKYFQFKEQRLLQVEQTFSIAGKHTNSVKLARINVELSRLIVDDLTRSLLYELAIQYTTLQTLQNKAALYKNMMDKVAQVAQAVEQQVKLGGMAGNDATRLKTEYIEMQAVHQQLLSDQETAMAQIRLLLAMPDNVQIIVEPRTRPLLAQLDLAKLVSLAKELRPDYLLHQKTIEYEKQNVKLQRSTAVPDVKVAYQPHDRGSNYVRPYSGVNLEMPIPVFNRNQGAIQEAQIRVKQAEMQQKQSEYEVAQQVTTAYNQFRIHREGINRYTPEFLQELEQLNQNAQLNYNRRNISLLEFIDQQRMYIQTQIQQIELLNGYLQTVNELNFRVGKSLVE